MAKPKTINDYIDQTPELAQPLLQELTATLRAIVPDATEAIKWGNHVFSYNRILFAFSAFKDHINFYPTPAVIEAMKKELADHPTTAAALQIYYDKPLPVKLIRKLALLRVKELKEKDAKWM